MSIISVWLSYRLDTYLALKPDQGREEWREMGITVASKYVKGSVTTDQRCAI